MVQRSIKFAVIPLALALTLGGCGDESDPGAASPPAGGSPSGSPSGDGGATGATLTIWVDETRQTAVKDAAGAFETATGTQVDVVLKNFDDIRPDFVAQVPTGERPDIIAGPWMLDQFEGLNLVIDPLPSAGGQEAQPFVGVQGFYLSARTENAILANDFLVNYLSSEAVQLALFEAGNRPPALLSAAAKAAEDPIIAGFDKAGANAVPMPSIPEMGSVWSFWGATEVGILNGSLEPVAAWDKMVSDIEGAIKA
jgi:arabinogalactan oligomer/maltooligosaccharide transport system substrate-binding protein